MQRGSEEEVEGDVEDEEFIDEEQESEEGEERRVKQLPVGRTVTLQMLLEENILQPGEANMSIEYMGQRFIGDLLSDGKIKSLETDIIFASPSAWACHCKRIINPDKKSGCGWASVKEEMELKSAETQSVRIPVRHCTLGNRAAIHDGNTLVESTPFSSMGKIQPFLVSLSTNAALVLDFHCHLTTSEVVGYLAGHWDVNAHNLAITHAFPCRSRLNDRELGPLVEEDIYRGLEQRRLTLVGWYHSHPIAPPSPTLRDIDAQLDYQIRMKGNSDASYTPCVGIICSPYFVESVSLESSLASYWVIPPPENKPHEYGKPMLMTYSVIQDQYLSQDALNEMKKCAEFYKGDQDYINFNEGYKGNITYLEKLKTSLSSKFPRDQNNGLLWNYLSEMISPGSTGETRQPTPHIPPPPPLTSSVTLASSSLPITIPSATKATSATSALPGYLGAEIASALFATGKFPTSLMGLSFPPPLPSVTTAIGGTTLSLVKPPLLSAPSPAKIFKAEDLLVAAGVASSCPGAKATSAQTS
ncbi:hypothetical protein AAG570_001927 [Ranatra chinensis]|uniref:MPN domain-containing protein n=1 Tax=Ranatra chinensis TaxID=642074 RepID=A0ABD0YA69_9HEMI